MELSNALLHGNFGHGCTISSKLCMQMMVLVMAAMVYSGGNAKMIVQAAKTPAAVELAPAPAPEPPKFENVTQSLVYGGNYATFISLLVETNLDVEFQSMANDTEGPGVTIFAPTDVAFSSKLVQSLLQNLTAAQKVTLLKYHALGYYQAFKNLQNSNNNQTSTLAASGGGSYQVNITFTGGGRLQISSGWTTAILSTTVYSKSPVSIFAIDHVLLPDEIFGLPPSPPPPSPPPPVRSPPPPTPSSSSPLKSSITSSNSSFSSPLFTLSISYLFMSLLLYKFLGIQFF